MVKTPLDVGIQCGVFFSLIGLGFLDPEQRHKDAHAEEQQQHDPCGPGDEDGELEKGA